MPPKCPNGYLEVIGTFSGATLGELEKNVTVDQCAEMCDFEILCNAFEYDVRSKSCKINHDPNPNSDPYKNYFFCQKESKNFFIHSLLNIKRNHHLTSMIC